MKLPGWKAVCGIFLATILSAPAWGATSAAGNFNYIEGQALIGSHALNSQSIGSIQLQTGQSLNTENGKAEFLLTPGVFMRVGDNSSVTMLSPTLTNTEVTINKGHAMVEVDQIHKSNDLRVVEDNATTRLLKTGLYDFDANQNQVRVFKGEAQLQDGERQTKVKGGHEVNLAALATSGKLKPAKFDRKEYEGDLYRFSSLRSYYLAQASQGAAQVYIANGWYGTGWWGPGWWWNPAFGGYTFFPSAGVLYSPFGWGFYAPVYVFHDHDRDWDWGTRFGFGRPYLGQTYAYHPRIGPDRDDHGGPETGELHEPRGFGFHGADRDNFGAHVGDFHGGLGIRR